MKSGQVRDQVALWGLLCFPPGAAHAFVALLCQGTSNVTDFPHHPLCSGDPSKCLQTIRCAATYAVGTLQNAFNKFAVLLRMQWGPFKMPSTNSLCCYVCSGDPSKCLQKIAVLLRMLWGPLKIPLTAIRAVRYMLTLPSEYLQITCRLPADYLLQT